MVANNTAAGEKTENDGGGKKNDDGKTGLIVLKLDIHCNGCAKKLTKYVQKHIHGVEDVKADITANKLTVTGKLADPIELRDTLARKSGKEVHLIFPVTKKPVTKKPDTKDDKKPSQDKALLKNKADDKKPKEVRTLVLKSSLHCGGCTQKLQRLIYKYKGVEMVNVDGPKEQVTVKGKMDVTSLMSYLNEKNKRRVELLPEKKTQEKKGKGGDGDGAKEKKPGGGGEKKEKSGDGGVKIDTNKMEYYGYEQWSGPSFWYGGGAPQHAEGGGEHQPIQSLVDNYTVTPSYHVYAPQMFSDENPNACSVM